MGFSRKLLLGVTIVIALVVLSIPLISNAQKTSIASTAISSTITWKQGTALPVINGHTTPPPQLRPYSAFINSPYLKSTSSFNANVVPPPVNLVHWYQGSVYEPTTTSDARTIKMTITVPDTTPPSPEFYYVIESAWDTASSYDQLGFTNDFGVWGLAYSWTSGGINNITYHYSPDAFTLTPGATYTFTMTTESGDTTFDAYQGSSLVWTLTAPTGGQYLYVDNFYDNYYAYTNYEEVYYVDNATQNQTSYSTTTSGYPQPEL